MNTHKADKADKADKATRRDEPLLDNGGVLHGARKHRWNDPLADHVDGAGGRIARPSPAALARAGARPDTIHAVLALYDFADTLDAIRAQGIRAAARRVFEEAGGARSARDHGLEALERMSVTNAPEKARRIEDKATLYGALGASAKIRKMEIRRDRTRGFVLCERVGRDRLRSFDTPPSRSMSGIALLAKEVLAKRSTHDAARAKQTNQTPSSPYRIRERGQVARIERCWTPERWVTVHEGGTRDMLRRMIESKRAQLDRVFKARTRIPEMRPTTSAKRSGPGGIKDGQAGIEAIRSRFGIYAFQFGHWVPQGERAEVSLKAAQGLHDLAVVLGWPARWMGLGAGPLRAIGLAFGARGRNGVAAAHYEPLERAINLTRRHGAGALAHEWWHALDNQIGAMTGAGTTGFATEETSMEEVGRRCRALGDACRNGPYGDDALKLDAKRLDRGAPPYWSSAKELTARLFETWVEYRLARLGIVNGYLVARRTAAEWAISAGEGNIHAQHAPYPDGDELERLKPTLESALRAVRTSLARAGATA